MWLVNKISKLVQSPKSSCDFVDFLFLTLRNAKSFDFLQPPCTMPYLSLTTCSTHLLCTILTHDTLRPSPTILRPCSDHSQVLRTTTDYLSFHISFYSYSSIRRSGPHPLRTSSDHTYCLLVTFTFPFVVTPPCQRPRNSSTLGPYPTSDLFLLSCLLSFTYLRPANYFRHLVYKP